MINFQFHFSIASPTPVCVQCIFVFSINFTNTNLKNYCAIKTHFLTDSCKRDKAIYTKQKLSVFIGAKAKTVFGPDLDPSKQALKRLLAS